MAASSKPSDRADRTPTDGSVEIPTPAVGVAAIQAAALTPPTIDAPPESAGSGSSIPSGVYRPVTFHAQGGLGEVLLAEDDVLHRPVALKRILASYADDPTLPN